MERFQKEELFDSNIWETLKEVEIVDDYKVIIRFNEPNVLCILNLARTPNTRGDE